MTHSPEQFDGMLRSIDPARGEGSNPSVAPDFAGLARQRTLRSGRLVAVVFGALALPVVGLALLIVRGGPSSSQFAVDGLIKGAPSAGQGVAVGSGSLVLGNAASEKILVDQNFRSSRDGFAPR